MNIPCTGKKGAVLFFKGWWATEVAAQRLELLLGDRRQHMGLGTEPGVTPSTARCGPVLATN